jgi:hypothetical protein
MTPNASATTEQAAAPNSTVPLVNKSGRRLTAAERAALTPTAQVDPKAAHDLLANKEQINPAANDKPVKGASVQKNRKGADPKPSKTKTAPKVKAPTKKADKEPAAPKERAVRPTGVIRAHPDGAHNENVPCDVSVNVPLLQKVRAQLGEKQTFGALVREWAGKTKFGEHTPQTQLPNGRGTRTIFLEPAVLKAVTAWEKASENNRFGNWLFHRMNASL